MVLKDRILKLIELEGLNCNQFYIKTGLGNGFLDKVGVKLKKPSIEKISRAFPHWNIDYLQNNDGEMIKTGDIEVSGNYNVVSSSGHAVNISDPNAKKINRDGNIHIERQLSAENEQQTIRNLETRISDLERIIKAKDDLIDVMRNK